MSGDMTTGYNCHPFTLSRIRKCYAYVERTFKSIFKFQRRLWCLKNAELIFQDMKCVYIYKCKSVYVCMCMYIVHTSASFCMKKVRNVEHSI